MNEFTCLFFCIKILLLFLKKKIVKFRSTEGFSSGMGLFQVHFKRMKEGKEKYPSEVLRKYSWVSFLRKEI